MNCTARIASLAVFLAAIFGLAVLLIRMHGGLNQDDARTADWVVANNVATRAEYLRIVYLRERVVDPNHRYALTEQDVDWLLAFADDPRFQGQNRELRQMYSCAVLVPAGRARLPQSRLAAMYAFGVSLVHTPEDDEDNNWAGCRILGHLGNKAAIPELYPLLSSRDKETRLLAEDALDDLGVDLPPSS